MSYTTDINDPRKSYTPYCSMCSYKYSGFKNSICVEIPVIRGVKSS